MVRGIFTSALGMTTQMQKLDVISNNLANVQTAGYKKDQTITRSFTEELISRINQPGDFMGKKDIGKISRGVFVDTIFTDFGTGTLVKTDNPFNAAILGDGFFVVNKAMPDGTVVERYTRSGEFTVGLEGQLVTSDGSVVVGEKGPIVLGGGTVRVDEHGSIFLNDVFVDKLRMVAFENNDTLRKTGDTQFSATADSVPTAFTGRVLQGSVENSNVNTVKEMVDMISTTRAYEANARVVSIFDTILGKSVTEIGRKF